MGVRVQTWDLSTGNLAPASIVLLLGWVAQFQRPVNVCICGLLETNDTIELVKQLLQ